MTSRDLQERLNHFLTNDWVHLERKVAALEARMHLVIAMLTVLIGLVVFTITQ